MDAIIHNIVKSTYNRFGRKDKTDIVNNLYEAPKKDEGKNMPKFQQYDQGVFQQADVVYLPNDGGYQYALVVTEVGTPRIMDAEPLNTLTSTAVKNALEKIYNRKILKHPINMTVDSGSEFKGDVKEYFQKHNVNVITAKVGRKRTLAIAERKNQTIGSVIHKLQKSVEVLTGKPTSQWVSFLPTIVSEINKHVIKNKPKPEKDKLIANFKDMLEQGDNVRVALDYPQEYITGSRLHGKFRASDIRWDPKIRTVKQVILKPNSPILYLLDGTQGANKVEPIGYTRNQLQLVKNEKLPDKQILKYFEDNSDRGLVDRLLKHVDEDGVRWFEVKWKDGTKSFQTRDNLIKDIPQMVKRYETTHNLNAVVEKPKKSYIKKAKKTDQVEDNPYKKVYNLRIRKQ